jgi:hypothetical protein
MNGRDQAEQIIAPPSPSLARRLPTTSGSVVVSERRRSLEGRVAGLLSGLAVTCGRQPDAGMNKILAEAHGWADWPNGWADWPNGGANWADTKPGPTTVANG